ncbi:hypothetical protein [Aureispira anguillae]|uniref:Uncharacterized protein n=1 Tax=Aureispira anguillae TaxID=2864201 RepID=A0A916DSI5_9BACT|nr:hypothetical protein [Aureispira anguillae]BDS12549.1 hypothetical protein AsAng_0032720 [Aureispira anguillae]
MAKLTQQEFEDQYGIELLPYSTADVSLGEMMHYKGIFNRTLTFLNYSIAEKLGWDEAKIAAIETQLKAIPLTDGSFPDLIMNNSTIGSGDLKIPILGLDLSNHVDASKVASFEFSKIKAKRLIGNVRSELSQGLEALKSSANKKVYNQELKLNYVIEGLFYADSVTIKLTEKLDIDLSLSLTNTKTNASLASASPSIKKNNDTTYTISNAGNCPFAVQLTKGKLF